jgi:mRNA interferase MazF
MKPVFYVPERGDVVWITPASRGSHGAAGRRPALVLSPQAYNARVGLALVCPIATDVTGYPFEVAVPPSLPLKGAALADQPASLDWRSHRAERLCSLPSPIVDEVLGKLRALLGWGERPA